MAAVVELRAWLEHRVQIAESGQSYSVLGHCSSSYKWHQTYKLFYREIAGCFTAVAPSAVEPLVVQGSQVAGASKILKQVAVTAGRAVTEIHRVILVVVLGCECLEDGRNGSQL